MSAIVQLTQSVGEFSPNNGTTKHKSDSDVRPQIKLIFITVHKGLVKIAKILLQQSVICIIRAKGHVDKSKL